LKNCDKNRRLYFLRIAHNRLKRKRRKFGQGRRKRRHLQHEVLLAPTQFDLLNKEYRQALLKFIRRMWQITYIDKNSLVIDFSATNKMISDGALLFRSELCLLLPNLGQNVAIKCKPPNNRKICQVLEQIGVFELLNYSSGIQPVDEDVIHWKIAQGACAEGEKYESILGDYDGVMPRELSEGFYVGVTEAMTNCAQHAYIEARMENCHVEPISTKWWMFSQRKDEHLYVVFCDLGIGIPRSLPIKKPSLFKSVLKLFNKVSDAVLIREAVKYSRSRTQQEHRGKGLKQFLSVLNNAPGGVLYIYSNKGCYTTGSAGDRTLNFRDSIYGTMISWRIPLNHQAINGENGD